jgi:hypothetical protein
VIRELQQYLPADKLDDPRVKELASWGCGTIMHVVRLLAPRLEGEDVIGTHSINRRLCKRSIWDGALGVSRRTGWSPVQAAQQRATPK